MKLAENPILPESPVTRQLTQFLREIAAQVNAISEGRQFGFYTAATAAPTTGTWVVGDFVLNSTPAEAGAPGAKYIIHGWRCTVTGAPGTWLQCRFLTGN